MRNKALRKLGSGCSYPGCNWFHPDALEIDHIIPVALSKQSRLDAYAICKQVVRMEHPERDFQLLCANHHRLKTVKDMEELVEARQEELTDYPSDAETCTKEGAGCQVKNANLLWAQGLIYFNPIWPFRGSVVPSRTYAEIMRRERQALYMPAAQVEAVLAREEAGLFQECVALGKRMREKIGADSQEHQTANQPGVSEVEDAGLRIAGMRQDHVSQHSA
jgi:hypothetical protein